MNDKVICKVCGTTLTPLFYPGKVYLPKHYKPSLVGGLHECIGSYEPVATLTESEYEKKIFDV
jgi:hypothetical protein